MSPVHHDPAVVSCSHTERSCQGEPGGVNVLEPDYVSQMEWPISHSGRQDLIYVLGLHIQLLRRYGFAVGLAGSGPL